MNEIIDNSVEFLKKMEGREKEESIPEKPRGSGRRLISPGIGGRRRQFAPTVRGEVFLQGGALDSSGAVSLGRDLPSLKELAKREEKAERQKEFLKNKKTPMPPPPKPRDDKFKI